MNDPADSLSLFFFIYRPCGKLEKICENPAKSVERVTYQLCEPVHELRLESKV